jgi:hypothetical protein
MYSFFSLAARSPTRQQTFRRVLAVHLAIQFLTIMAGGRCMDVDDGRVFLGCVLLIAGIVEGAVLIGWRLTQLPKSQALEFLLVTPLQPRQVFLAEAGVGLAFLTFVALSGLPLLALLQGDGWLRAEDLLPLLLMPLTWGALTGLGLTVWAYEPIRVRRWGERIALVLVVLQLLIGVLAGEHLRRWLEFLPCQLGQWSLDGFQAFHRYNPFAVLRSWLEDEPAAVRESMLGLELAALAAVGVLFVRGASRLQGHFQDRHYQVKRNKEQGSTASAVLTFSFFLFPFSFSERPLAWWAVRRVSEYSGRINLWLAGGFGLLYTLYLLAGPAWPAWLGRQVFVMVDQHAGVSGVATGLIVLAAVPAVFQYGLWDSSAQDRCRRLELLLLTQMDGMDYWEAAAAAAWSRGRGYFAMAALLWFAGAAAGRLSLVDALAALAAGVALWGLYFAVGFQAFARGIQANALGMLLTLGLPLVAWVLFRLRCPDLATLIPAGSVYGAGEGLALWVAGAVLAAAFALDLARQGQAICDAQLRRWYELHHGRKVMT